MGGYCQSLLCGRIVSGGKINSTSCWAIQMRGQAFIANTSVKL
jgi:hypothetical protein